METRELAARIAKLLENETFLTGAWSQYRHAFFNVYRDVVSAGLQTHPDALIDLIADQRPDLAADANVQRRWDQFSFAWEEWEYARKHG